jgi:outer membrane biosynthesis protein TonB
MKDPELQRHDLPGRRAFAGSVAVHLGLLLLVWWTRTSHAAPVEYVTYEIDLISPPPAVVTEDPQPAQEEELVVETPDPEPEAVEPEPEPIPPPPEEEPEPEPDPVPVEPEEEAPQEDEPPAEAPPAPEPAETPTPASTDEPVEDAAESGEDLNVRIEGIRRDYPAYYNNIIRQIRRCFRWKGEGNPTTVLRFVIQRDGEIPDRSVEVVRASGDVEFDFEMMGTVECASGRLGPLPEEYPFDQLPIQFSFAPDAVREDGDD